MSRTYINIQQVSSADISVRSSINSISGACSSLNVVKENVDAKIRGRNNIDARMNSLVVQLKSVEAQINRINSTVKSGLMLYEVTDEKIEAKAAGVRNSAVQNKAVVSGFADMFKTGTATMTSKLSVDAKAAATATVEKKESVFKAVGKKAGEVILENAGLGGGIISSVAGLYNTLTGGKIEFGAVAKGTKSVISSVYKIVKNNSKLEKLSRMNPGQAVKTGVKRFLGLEKAFTGNLRPSVAKSFKTRFYNNYQKQLADNLDAFKGKGMKSALAWAGVAISGITNGISNYKEAKSGEISAGRAVAETITETVVDVASGVVIGAAVSAGIAALGFASAPVLVVGAATAAVTMGLDWASNAIFGKGMTELISDTVLDVGTAVVKGAAKVVSKTVEAVSDIGKAAGKAIGKAGKKVGDFFKKIF